MSSISGWWSSLGKCASSVRSLRVSHNRTSRSFGKLCKARYAVSVCHFGFRVRVWGFDVVSGQLRCSGHMPSPHPAMASMGSFSGQSCAAPMRCGDVYAGGFGSSSQVLPSQIPAQHMPPANTYPTAPAMYESQPSASTYCNGATAPGMDHMTSPYTQQYPHSHPMPGEHPYPALQSPPQPHEPTPNQPAPDAAHAYPDLAPPDNFYDSPTFQPTHQPAYDVPPAPQLSLQVFTTLLCGWT